jgi:phosphatidate cytidylyltransferase
VAEDEGTDRRSEDLFEDLDKFFAPIQDVDWPDEDLPSGTGGAATPPPATTEVPPATGAGEPGGGTDVFDDDLDTPIVWEDPAPPTPTPTATEPAPAEDDHAGFRSTAAADARSSDHPTGDVDAAAPETGGTTGGSGSLAEDMFGSAGGAPSESPSGVPASSDDMFGAGASPGPPPDDLLPTGWASGLEGGIDLDLDVPASSDDAPAPESGRFLGEPTAQMSGDDWAELGMTSGPEDQAPGPGGAEGGAEPYSYMERFLPDDEGVEVPEFGYGPDPGAGATPSGGTTGIDWGEPAVAPGPAGGAGSIEDSGPISIDDLRRAPDAYRDLPGPDAGPAPAGEPATPGPPPGFDSEPGDGDLEAAAEHFAASIREQEPGLGMAHDDPFAEHGAAPDPFADHADEGVDLLGAGEHREPYSDHPEPLLFPDGEDEHDDLLSFGQTEDGPRTVKVSAAEGVGPSWQEPTSADVPGEGEHEPPRPSRNLSAAIVTGVVLTAVALLALLAGKEFFGFVAGAVVLLAQVELYTAIRTRGFQPAVPLGLAVGVLICFGGYLKGESGILAMTTVGALFTPLWFMATPARQRKNVVANMGMTMFGILAVPFLGGFALAIIHSTSRAFTIMVLILAFGYDIAAYGIGTLTGNKPLAPSISPNKTREGAIGGFLVLAIIAIFLKSVSPISSYVEAFGLAAAAGMAALLGDLAESLIKRDLGVKDMGTIFPGHGGALDRIDSILFVAPVVYYFLLVFVF